MNAIIFKIKCIIIKKKYYVKDDCTLVLNVVISKRRKYNLLNRIINLEIIDCLIYACLLISYISEYILNFESDISLQRLNEMYNLCFNSKSKSF